MEQGSPGQKRRKYKKYLDANSENVIPRSSLLRYNSSQSVQADHAADGSQGLENVMANPTCLHDNRHVFETDLEHDMDTDRPISQSDHSVVADNTSHDASEDTSGWPSLQSVSSDVCETESEHPLQDFHEENVFTQQADHADGNQGLENVMVNPTCLHDNRDVFETDLEHDMDTDHPTSQSDKSVVADNASHDSSEDTSGSPPLQSVSSDVCETESEHLLQDFHEENVFTQAHSTPSKRNSASSLTFEHDSGSDFDILDGTVSNSAVQDGSIRERQSERSNVFEEEVLFVEHRPVEDDDLLKFSDNEQDCQDIPLIPPEANQQDPEGIPEAPPSFIRLRQLLQGDFQGNIHEPVNSSKAEALLMALGLSLQHNFNNKEFVDTIKLINSIFGSPVLPQTSYLLDKLLASDCGSHYHFYCRDCHEYFGEVDYKVVKVIVCQIEGCGAENVIQDLTKASFFIIYDISFQLQLLFQNHALVSLLKSPQSAVNDSAPSMMTDIYDGACYKKFAKSVEGNCSDKIISFTFSTDGSPVFKSSPCSIWPLQFIVNELPPIERMKNILLGGLWFGKSKPPMDLFLLPFLSYSKTLATDGLRIIVEDSLWTVKVFFILCCVDSGARGAVQGLKSHSGYSSCNWCKHPGEWFAGAVKFPCIDHVAPLRTHAGVVKCGEQAVCHDSPVEGVKAISTLVKVPLFDIVDGFAVEYMHLVNLGIVRQFLYAWMEDAGEEWYIGGEEREAQIDAKIQGVAPPVEVRRMPRSISDRKFWNARELENWLIFFSVPVLTSILKPKYLNHWIFLVQAIYLLLKRELSHDHVDLAHQLLIHFITKTEVLYGKRMMTFNVHVLGHLAQHVVRWGPLFATSAFCFEGGNGELKGLIHAQRGISHQIDRALSRKMAFQLLKAECSTVKTESFLDSIKEQRVAKYLSAHNCHFIGASKTFYPSQEEDWLCTQAGHSPRHCVLYDKLVKERHVYNTSTVRKRKTNNSVALLEDQSIILINKILYDQVKEEGFILGVQIVCSRFCRLPVNVDVNHHCLRKICVSEDVKFVSVKDLSGVCFMSLPVNDYIVPIPNIYNIF